MSRYHDDSTCASDPGGVHLTLNKLKSFQAELDFLDRICMRFLLPPARLDEHLQLGDSRAALVMRVVPDILVAAYSDELDCVAMLKFPQFVKRFFTIKQGTRLLTVNTYFWGTEVVQDLRAGPQYLHRYRNFYPIIAEFLSNNITRIEERKRKIAEDEWERTEELAWQVLAMPGFTPRNGSPYRSFHPVVIPEDD
ncbi:MAG: hypothetical protein ACYDCO_13540 [Armatimonadota bacterium]